jgi:acyl-CoA thioesterase FadM
MTASLSVQYRRPTPLFTRLLFEVRIREQKGRKVTVRGALRDGDGVVAEADGLFVLPNSGITRDLGQIVREPSRSTPRGRS